MSKKIKVLIADDQKDLAEGIKSVLQTDEEIEVVGIAHDGFEAIDYVKEFEPDVVLMDIRMPNMNGVVATQRIQADYPNVKVIVLTTFDDSDYILNAINNGACGYLLKDIGATTLINSIKNALAGDMILPMKVARRIADAAKNVTGNREFKLKRAVGLSDREVEIALMVYEGFTNRQISSALHISEGTARNHISAIYEKLHCENRTEAVQVIKTELVQ